MRDVVVERLQAQPTAEQPIEVVERKGLGHPDSICDGVAEHVSAALARAYLDRCGYVLHYNVDKGLLAAGSVEHRFGGGRVVAPMRLVLGDRATFVLDGGRIAADEIAEAAARDWFRTYLPRVNADLHLRVQPELRPSAPELASIFRRGLGPLSANDTSALVGYAPLTPTERLVIETERYLNSGAFKDRFPDTGEDVKVMGVRRGADLSLTVAMPLLEQLVADEPAYFRRKAEVEAALQAYVRDQPGASPTTAVSLNTLDEPGHGTSGVYLSLLGTSAEDADSGEVGRGNRVNGVISLQRPAPAEAAAGKNPVSHPGKIYNVLAHRAAQRAYTEVEGLREVYVWLCSEIGAPLDRPRLAAAQVVLANGVRLEEVRGRVAAVLEDELAHVSDLTGELLAGRHAVF